MKGRFVAAVALSIALASAPACRMEAQKPNLNKAPITETIRDAGVRMADSNKEKLNALVPAKAQPEQKVAEQPDAGITQKKPPAKIKSNKEENPFKSVDWSVFQIKATPRGPEPKKEGRIH